MKFFLALLIFLLLVSCQNKIIDIEPIAPRAVRVSELSISTAHKSTKVKENTQEIKATINSLQAEINRSYLEAEKLKKAGIATQAQLDANYKNWESVNIKNQFLESAAKSAMVDAIELEKSAHTAKVEVAALKDQTIKADKTIADLKLLIAKQSEDVARGRMVSKITWIVIGTIILAGILFLVGKILPIFTRI